MGNRISAAARRRPVEDRLTRPQRLLRQPLDVDYNKLRKLILARKLAPCFDALEEPPNRQLPHRRDLEECPICFFYYPSLNRSRCCSKGICTECFLQMRPSSANGHVQCPFCKSSCYAVEYRGPRTEEEKDQEQAEEQKVVEAKLRLQCESRNMERVIPSGSNCVVEMSGLGSSPTQTNDDVNHPAQACNNRNNHPRINLEEIMVMEAIWDSLQDSRARKSGANQDAGSSNLARSKSVGHEMIGAATPPSSAEAPSAPPDGVPLAISRLPEQGDFFQAQYNSELDCERNQTKLNPHGSSSEEPNTRPLLVECPATSLDSDEEHAGCH